MSSDNVTDCKHKSKDDAQRESRAWRPRRRGYDLALDGGDVSETPIERVIERLDRVSTSGDGYVACCPAHPDSNPSLSVSEGTDGRVLLYCHAMECEASEIVEAIGLKMSDLFAEPDTSTTRENSRQGSRDATNPAGKRQSAAREKTTGPPACGRLVTAPGAKHDWARFVRQYQRQCTLEVRNQLAKCLGVRRDALESLGVGWAKPWGRWMYTFPEHDGLGRITGISTRGLDGKKLTLKGSERGLFLPRKWHERPGPVFIAEGASDVAALLSMDLAGIGRPFAGGGVNHLCQLLAAIPNDRTIIVLGESDAKPDGSWPGRDGAIKVAKQLVDRLGRKVGWALPSGGEKDVRAWLSREAKNES